MLLQGKEKADYKVHILLQGSKTPSTDNPPADTATETPTATPTATPSTSAEPASDNKDDTPVEKEDEEKEKPEVKENPVTSFSTPTASSSGIYACHACQFTTQRLNVLILHNKTHSVSFTPYTPSPVRKKPITKVALKPSPKPTTTPKSRKPRKEKPEKEIKSEKSQNNKKRAAEEESNNAEPKKVKTNEEIKSSLLADWDDGDEESNDESSTIVTAGSPEVPEAAESPAVPTSAELSGVQILAELSSPTEKKSNSSPTSEKPESSSDSKYEFCEDEDWPIEADAGRKIPRVKNPKRKEDTKSLSLDDEDMAREVAELLNKTTVPDLPSAPEPLKVEENFPEPSIIKSPDKLEKSPDKSDNLPAETPPTKAIFKTKTFFRSRHSRSQDAIGKYVAEQLNANSVERMDISESEINGSEAVSSPEARESPPVEHVKVARLAPKIQLKKMKAELREKSNFENFRDIPDLCQFGDVPSTISLPKITYPGKDKTERGLQDVLYPTQEIKPVNTDTPEPIKVLANKAEPEIIMNTTQSEIEDETYKQAITEETLSRTEVMVEPETIDETIDQSANVDSTINLKEISTNTLHIEETTDVNKTDAETIVEKMDTTYNTVQVKGTNENEAPENTAMENEEIVEAKMDSVEEVNNIVENAAPIVKFPETSLQKAYEPFMNESTASAVDALLSVSREADRVTRIISDDPPEDLFEDDNKDNSGTSTDMNGFSETSTGNIFNNVNGDKDIEQEKYTEETQELKSDLNISTGKNSSEMIEDKVSVTDENIVTNSNDMYVMSNQEEISDKSLNTVVETAPSAIESIPSESDLQIAETLINLPSTAIQIKTSSNHGTENLPADEIVQDELPLAQPADEIVLEEKTEEVITEPEPIVHQTKSLLISNNENIIRFETEQEKSENLNAAQSLVQMSESIDHKINIEHNLASAKNKKDIPEKAVFNPKHNNNLDSINTVEQKIILKSNELVRENTNGKNTKLENSSKLLKILEEPCAPKFTAAKPASTKQIVTGKEKILNFDVAKTTFKPKYNSDSPKQKIIIRRTTPNKTVINDMVETTTADKIILSRSNNPAHDGSVQTYTIQTSPEAPSDANTIIIQQKIRKIAKPPAKLQKIKPANSLIPPLNETSKIINDTSSDDVMFDINSMPIVLSEDLITPESIEKMPIVMSDGNIITHSPNPPKLVKTKSVENEKIAISATPNKSEMKTLLMNPVVSEVSKVSTPNILSKSSKLRGAKPMLIIDKATGKQKIIMAKGDTPQVKEVKQTLIQSVPQNTGKSEKFIILPTPSSPRPGRTQKIVIDPQTGKAHVLVAKGSEPQISSTDKPVSAKLIPSSTDATAPGNTVMIITNAQGGQSRIVLTPEHEKMLFPKKQQANVSQLKTITHRISTNSNIAQKTVVSTIAPTKSHNAGPARTPTRLVPKQKNAIITSKGQLIVGGRVATTAQNIAPMPEIRPVPKRIMASEPKKLVQTIQKNSSEPLIFLQQKSGSVIQLTASQFEHLQRTGQLLTNKTTAAAQENKMIVQKTITISSNESAMTTVHRPRVRKTVSESPTPMKKIKQEIAIAPAPPPLSPMPALAPLSNNIPPTLVPSASNTVSVASTTSYPEFDNFEELLPSTAIVKQHPDPAVMPFAPQPDPPTAVTAPSLSDGQLLAVPGEHFGGPIDSFYLCIEDKGTLTPIDHRPLVLENNQLVPMAVETLPVFAATQPERRDILEAALANSDVFHADTVHDEAPDFRDLNANVSVHCRVSETSTTLNQPPIMTPVELPTKVDSEQNVPSNLEDGLAVIGVTPPTVPTSLELPITVTDPRIAPAKTTDPLSSNNYRSGSLLPSPNTEMTFVTTEEADIPMGEPISMPLLTEEESVGKSMPILTDDITERTVSSVDSTVGSPSSIDVRESETEDGGQWTRRLLTPGSDSSETSSEIPLQPAIQLSVTELSRHS